MTLFKDSHHFSSLWWHSWRTAITSAVFDDTLWRQTSIQQNFGSLWWDFFKTAITSAVFDDSAFLKRTTLRGRFREKWFSWPQNHFFAAVCRAAVDNAKSEKPQQIAVQFHKNDFRDPKSHFFPRKLPSSSRQRKKGEIPAIPSNRHSLIPQTWFSRPKSRFSPDTLP